MRIRRVLAVALVVLCTAAGLWRTAAADARSAPVPRGFAPASVSAVSTKTFWVLGTVPCGTSSCPAIARTTDAGRTFVALPAPRAPLAADDASDDTVAEVRFAGPRDGWTYGGALYATYDGGAHWRRLTGLGRVLRLEAAAGRAYALVRTGKGYALALLSGTSTDRWRPLSLRWPGDGPAPDLAAQGRTVVVWSGDGGGSGRMYVSRDGGASWRSAAAPGCLIARLSAGAGAFWMGCATGMMGGVLRSADGLRWLPVGTGADTPNSVRVGARTVSAAVFASCESLYAGDVGSGFRRLAAPTAQGCGWRYIGFTTPSVGFALRTAPDRALYRTTDGGRHWRRVTF